VCFLQGLSLAWS